MVVQKFTLSLDNLYLRTCTTQSVARSTFRDSKTEPALVPCRRKSLRFRMAPFVFFLFSPDLTC